tara:strand:+ start:256 stop:732 length:477 start_codon:yes stop_codon:yes gene_type:complete
MENWRKFINEAKNKDGKEQGADGKACWGSYKHTGTEDGKDKCAKINEEEQECKKCSGADPDAECTCNLEEKIDKESMPCNKPRTTSSHKGKSHVVKACEDGKEKIIPFGEKGASTAGKPKKGESDKMKAKRKSFKARHRKNIKKGKMSAAYWADKVKW